MKLGIKKTNIKYNNYSGLSLIRDSVLESYQGRPQLFEAFKPSYALSKVRQVRNESDAIRNRITDFDKRRISESKTQ